ncbi:MAG: diacylglycerol kinase family protein [Myxococcota bacterium]
MRIAVLNNLRAGRNSAEVTRILSLLRSYPEVVHIETDSARALPEALAEIARQNINLLVLNGGDGTLQYTLTEILSGREFDRIPMLAPLRGGRTNMTAADLGARRNPVKGLRGLLEDAKAGRLSERIVNRPVLRIETHKGRTEQYGMFFGAGMIHRAIDLTHRLFPPGRSQGAFGAALVTAGLIARASLRDTNGVLAPDKLQIVLDGEMVPDGEFYLVIASSLDRLFLRMNPFWGDGPGDVRFSSIASSAHRVSAAAPWLLGGRARPFVSPETGYTSTQSHRAELRLDCGFTIDGEIFEPVNDEVVTITSDRRVTFVRS